MANARMPHVPDTLNLMANLHNQRRLADLKRRTDKLTLSATSRRGPTTLRGRREASVLNAQRCPTCGKPMQCGIVHTASTGVATVGGGGPSDWDQGRTIGLNVKRAYLPCEITRTKPWSTRRFVTRSIRCWGLRSFFVNT
jgi:hypothetical protein